MMVTSLPFKHITIKVVDNLIPICAWCKRVRDQRRAWQKVDLGPLHQTNYEFTHTICPDCEKSLAV